MVFASPKSTAVIKTKSCFALVLAIAVAALVVATSVVSIAKTEAVADDSGATFESIALQGDPFINTYDSFMLIYSFTPGNADYENWYSEDGLLRESKSNYTVSSTNANVVEASIAGEDTFPSVNLDYKTAGTATVTLTYYYEGQYGTYTASQVVDITVIEESNYITGMTVSAGADADLVSAGSFDIPIVLNCAICEGTHGHVSDPDLLVDVTSLIPDSALTSDVRIIWEVEKADPEQPDILEV